ncbi:uncharacterized protein [Rutidosis leptorrhynchoides]|uniref:uncharacterized protein n=1 Tax=Rutidosis leptorrhynchoides TaxID=125765 RepID=UPI003A992B77
MAHHNTFFVCTLLIFSLSFHGTDSALNFEVINQAAQTPGGMKFDQQLGIPGAKEILAQVNDFIWNEVLEQTTPEDRIPMDHIEVLILENIVGGDGVASANHINVSAIFFQREPDIKHGFRHLMSHEMTHCLQWNGEGTTPQMLVEGIADYTTLRAKTVDRARFEKPGDGEKWDQGYHITALFLEYCDTVTPSFVAKLNKMMRKKYDVGYFKEITGKPVEQLWSDYKAKYGGKLETKYGRKDIA